MRGSERTPVGKLNKTLVYPLIGQFWPTLSTLKQNWHRYCKICDMAAVRDLSMSDMVLKSVINNTLKCFSQVECLREEEKDCIKIWSMADVFAILPTSYLSTLFTTNVCDEWKSQHHLHYQSGLSSSQGHNERPSWTVEQNWSCSNCIRYWQRTRKCEIWHLYICLTVFSILTFRFAGFGASVICHVVLIPFLGSFLLQSLSIGSSSHVTGPCRQSISGQKDLLLVCPQGFFCCPSAHVFFFIFLHTVFRTAPRLTECLLILSFQALKKYAIQAFL